MQTFSEILAFDILCGIKTTENRFSAGFRTLINHQTKNYEIIFPNRNHSYIIRIMSSGETQLFSELCRSKDLKVTKQREIIYRALEGNHDHPSADDVYRIVHAEHPSISFDTVNRTLLTFAESGIITIVKSHMGIRRFDPDISMHHHIHCVKCGKIIDFRDAEYDNITVPKNLSESFRVLQVRVSVNGICSDCEPLNKVTTV